MKKKNMGKGIVCICMVMIMLATGCKASAIDTENTVPDETTIVTESAKDTTETAIITIPTMETTEAALTPAETTAAATVKETTAAVTTIAPAATTKATNAPATTKVPVATTASPPAETAAPPVETAPPAVTTAAVDYAAQCEEIRAKLIANLEANGQWDPNGVTDGGWGQKWWEVGYFEDYNMSTQEVADEYYKYKFEGASYKACRIDCYVADGKIYLDYFSFLPA